MASNHVPVSQTILSSDNHQKTPDLTQNRTRRRTASLRQDPALRRFVGTSVQSLPDSIDRIALLKLIKSCGKDKDLKKLRQMDAHVVDGFIRSDAHVATALIVAYNQCGVPDKAREVFEHLPTQDIVAWNALIAGYAQHGVIREAVQCLRQMQATGTPPNDITYIVILKACGNFRSLEIGEAMDAEVRKQGLLEKNVMLGNTLVSMYSKCGEMEKARHAFRQLPERNVVSWNALITGYVQNGRGQEALRCFTRMNRDEGVRPDAVTYICVLKACGITGSIQMGKEIDVAVRKQRLLGRNTVLGTALVDMYSKCGALQEAQEAFRLLPVCDITSWNALIAGHTQHGLCAEALKFYERMNAQGILPNTVTYICILKACGMLRSLEFGENVHADIRRQNVLQQDVALGTALVDMYLKCDALAKARDVFEQLPVRDAVSWNALISGYVQHGLADEALDCFRRMQDEGFRPQTVTYICVVKACASIGCLEMGSAIDSEVTKQGLLQEDIMLGTALLDMYAKCGALDKAREVFKRLPVQDVVIWNALICGYAEQGLGEEVFNCFRQMKDDGIRPNAATYACVLKSCGILGALDIGEGIMETVARKQGELCRDGALGNALVDMYSKCGLMDRAQETFEQLSDQEDVVSWNVLITGYVQRGLGEEALDCFRTMQDKQVVPDVVTYLCVLKACGIVGSLEVGRGIHARVKTQSFLQSDVVLDTAIVDMYSKCGALENAQDAFEQIPVCDVVPWNALIAGYAQLGEVPVVLAMYEKMRRDGVAPNSITFILLLTACSHAGLLEEGQKFFHEMCILYRLVPEEEHYGCVIDLYGRAGHFEMVEAVLEMVTGSGYLPLFLSTLGACIKWGNVKLARRAFEQAVRLDAKCIVAYICMENVYVTAAGRSD